MMSIGMMMNLSSGIKAIKNTRSKKHKSKQKNSGDKHRPFYV